MQDGQTTDDIISMEKTIQIPLRGRIYASKHYPEYLYDEKALALEARLPDDPPQNEFSEYLMMMFAARYRNNDNIVKSFLAKQTKANVVYLGAGLDAAFYRIRDWRAFFYEVDTPDVIELRRTLYGEEKREILFEGDIFDMTWAQQVSKAVPTMIVASGLLQYFDKGKVLALLKDIRTEFEKTEIVFEAVNRAGLKFANKYIQRFTGKEGVLRFSVDDVDMFASDIGAVLVEERPLFAEARKLLFEDLKLRTRMSMSLTDRRRNVRTLHLKFDEKV